MTDDMTPVREPDAEAPAPAGHHYADFHGRRVLVRNVSVGQRMVAQGIANSLEAGTLTDADVPRLMNKIWVLVEALLPQQGDMDFVEMLLLRGTIGIEDLAPLVLVPVPSPPKTGPASKPRRGK